MILAFYTHVAPLGLNAAMHQNSRWDIHRRGGVSPPNGLGDPTPTDSTSLYHLPISPYPGGTCRPSEALRYLVYPMFYKHVAPLGLNAAMHQSRWDIHRRGGVSPPNGLGDPTPRDSTSLYHLPISPYPGGTCRPAGALRYLVYPLFYKHVAPLGLNAAMHQNSRWDIHRRGGVSPPNGLGDPTPRDSTSLYHLPIFPYPGGTCRPAGALRYLVYPLFYKHAAPLGLNAAMHQNSRWDIHRRGGVSPPNGLGDPTPTDSTSLYHLPISPYPGGTCRPAGALRYLVYPLFYKHAAPLGLNAAMHQNSRWDIHRRGGVSPPNGLGDPTPTDSTSLYHLPIFPYPCGTCRPSEALRYLVYPMFYKHAAPLGLNAAMHQNSRWDIHRRGGVSPPNGLGDPTPTDSTSLYHLPIFPYPCGTCRPSGALVV